MHSNLFFLDTTVLPLANFFLTPAGRYFLFKRTVPVKLASSNNKDSAKGTVVYELSVKRLYPWPVIYKCHLKLHIYCRITSFIACQTFLYTNFFVGT